MYICPPKNVHKHWIWPYVYAAEVVYEKTDLSTTFLNSQYPKKAKQNILFVCVINGKAGILTIICFI